MFDDRRSFLKALSTLAVVGVADQLAGGICVAKAAEELMPPPDLFDASLVDVSFWTQPRKLQMVRPQSGEQLEILYWKDGVRNQDAYEQICDLLRDVQANQSARMDPELINTLWAAQAFVRRYGFKAPIEITSGFRTVQTNNRLVEAGLPAARHSLHTQGKAADFRMNGLHPEILGTLVKGFKSGGVGFYFRIGSKGGGWIHADTGVERVWNG